LIKQLIDEANAIIPADHKHHQVMTPKSTPVLSMIHQSIWLLGIGMTVTVLCAVPLVKERELPSNARVVMCIYIQKTALNSIICLNI